MKSRSDHGAVFDGLAEEFTERGLSKFPRDGTKSPEMRVGASSVSGRMATEGGRLVEGVAVSTCEKCGAAVMDGEKHQAWHDELDGVDSTAYEALEKAEWASNVLYQNNISI